MKKRIYSIASFLLILIFCLSNKTKCQDKPNIKLSLQNDKIVYTQPKNYTKVSENIYLVRTHERNEFPGLLNIVLENSKKTFAIGLVLLPIIYSSTRDSLRANYSYLATLKLEQDESSFKSIGLYKKNYSITKADSGIIYQLKLEKLFLNKYDSCRVLVLHKENVADAFMYFFYKKENTSIDEEIKKNCSTLIFK